jgi:type IV fimbrial biogenesis protein FimT
MKNNNTGFTLLELMIVVAIAGVLLLVGIPSFRSMIITNELSSVTNDLQMSLKMARNSAITSGHTAYVCGSSNAATCAPGVWNRGWLVWADINNNTTFEVAIDQLLWIKEIDPSSRLTIAPSNNFATQIDFRFDGTLLGETAGSFQICSGLGGVDGYAQRWVNLTVSGEPQFTRVMAPRC